MSNASAYQAIVFAIVKVIAGLAMLVGGGEMLIKGATRLARWYGMSTLMIGLTVVAFGTSVPELFVSFTASLQGHTDIMIGNVVGSNTANVGLVLGLSTLLVPLKMISRTVRLELVLVIIGSIVLIGAGIYGFFPRALGLIFILTIVMYTVNAYQHHGNSKLYNNDAGAQGKQLVLVFIYFLIIGGLVLLAKGSNIFINGAAEFARFFGISELVIGLTLAAVGTSLPELASSLAALRHRESNLLIGNIIGSNMFNLFMVLGLTSVVKPFPLSLNLLYRDLPVMLLFSLALILILHINQGTNRYHGFIFLACYCLYCFMLL